MKDITCTCCLHVNVQLCVCAKQEKSQTFLITRFMFDIIENLAWTHNLRLQILLNKPSL